MIQARTAVNEIIGIQNRPAFYDAGFGPYVWQPSGSIFSPAVLFAQGEQGVWYDPSDMTTLFQDSAGTTPVVAVEQPVGLMLDKSKTYVSVTSLPTMTCSATVTQNGNVLTFNSSPVNDQASGTGISSTGFYQMTFTVAGTGSVLVYVGAAPRTFSAGTYTLAPWAAASASFFIFRANPGGFNGTVTFQERRDWLGNHAFQATSASRPVLSARYNLLTRTQELTNSAWTKQSGVTVSSTLVAAPDGSLTAFTVTGNGTSGILQNIVGSTSLGQTTRAVYLRVATGTTAVILKDPVQTQGTVTCNLTTAWQRFTLTETTTPSGSFVGGIWISTIPSTGIEVAWPDLRVSNDGVGIPVYQRVNVGTPGTSTASGTADYDTTGFPPYLRFDGVDDSMATASINPGAIDKAQVFAGVRKITTGRIVETSVNSDVNNGSLYVSGNSTNYEMQLRGDTTIVYYNPATFNSPLTNVVSCLFDIAGALRADEVKPRINGVLTQTGGAGTASGGGNFGSYPLYVGSRAGTVALLNGRLYSLITRFGTTLDATTITSTETWVNGKTKAYA
jgi:hypothetical protein